MGRARLGKHELGKIKYVTVVSREDATKANPPKCIARAQFRDSDDVVRQIERSGRSETAAKKALEAYAKHRRRGAAFTSGDTLEVAAESWFSSIQHETADTSMYDYRGRWANHIRPALGGTLLADITSAAIQNLVDDLAQPGTNREKGLGPGTRRGVRSVLKLILAHAVLHGALDTNPMDNTRGVRGTGKAPAEAFTVDELRDFLTKMDRYFAEAAERKGGSQKPDPMLADLIRFLFGTGCRYGEALALTWRHINLTGDPVRVEGKLVPPHHTIITGNLVHVAGKGVVRHKGKSVSARRLIPLPGFLVTLLTVRRPAEATDDEPVFPAQNLRWKHPHNVGRSVRLMRDRIGYPDFTTHRGRKTVATILESKGHTARQVADLLGHSNVTTTQNAYFGRGQVNTRAAEDLDALHRR